MLLPRSLCRFICSVLFLSFFFPFSLVAGRVIVGYTIEFPFSFSQFLDFPSYPSGYFLSSSCNTTIFFRRLPCGLWTYVSDRTVEGSRLLFFLFCLLHVSSYTLVSVCLSLPDALTEPPLTVVVISQLMNVT